MMPGAENPLLGVQFRIPFDAIRAEHVEPAMEELVKGARARLEALAADPAPRSFENTMLVLDEMTEPLDYAMGVVRHLEAVATYPELRAAHNAVEGPVSAFYSGIPLHAGLWSAVKSYAATDEAARLNGTRRRFLTKTVDTFRRHGADLDAAGKARLEAIDVELTQITTKFSENVLDSTNAFELVLTDERQLAGLPESARAAARQSAASKNLAGWRFTLQAPSYLALMTYLDDGPLREQVYRAQQHARLPASSTIARSSARAGAAPRESAVAGVSPFRGSGSGRSHGAFRRSRPGLPRRSQSKNRSALPSGE